MKVWVVKVTRNRQYADNVGLKRKYSQLFSNENDARFYMRVMESRGQKSKLSTAER
jgi:hypothetical protein